MIKSRFICISICLAVAAAADGKESDLRKFINSEIQKGRKTITIRPGRYRIKPIKRQHLLLSGLNGVTINAQGVEIICTETTRALMLYNCRNVTIKGLTIDYDPLPYTQGKIVKISPDGRTHDIQLFDGYAQEGNISLHKYEIFSAKTRTLVMGSYYGCKLTKLGKGKIRVLKPDRYKDQPEKVGDIIAAGCANAPGGSIPHAVMLDRCSNVILEGMTLYRSNCFGFYETGCNASVYVNCVVDRRPAATDFKKRQSPRIRSLNADAYHSKYAKIGPSYLQCKARFMGDDCVAINGDYHLIVSAAGNTLRVIAKRRMNIDKGDKVEFLAFQGVRPSGAKVVSIRADGAATSADEALIKKLRLHPAFKEHQHGALTKVYMIVLDRAVRLKPASLVCSANRIGNGFKVIGCRMGENRSRGIIVKAGNGLISGNTMDGCRMQSILLSPEFYWLEAGAGDNVLIKDNIIRNSGAVSIKIDAVAGNGKASSPGAHRSITITGNRMENCRTPQIYAASTDGLIIKGNVIVENGKPVKSDDSIRTGNSVNVKR